MYRIKQRIIRFIFEYLLKKTDIRVSVNRDTNGFYLHVVADRFLIGSYPRLNLPNKDVFVGDYTHLKDLK